MGARVFLGPWPTAPVSAAHTDFVSRPCVSMLVACQKRLRDAALSCMLVSLALPARALRSPLRHAGLRGVAHACPSCYAESVGRDHQEPRPTRLATGPRAVRPVTGASIGVSMGGCPGLGSASRVLESAKMQGWAVRPSSAGSAAARLPADCSLQVCGVPSSTASCGSYAWRGESGHRLPGPVLRGRCGAAARPDRRPFGLGWCQPALQSLPPRQLTPS